jgi:hypothetical protein
MKEIITELVLGGISIQSGVTLMRYSFYHMCESMFENRVLRRIFGPKRDEATGDWRR